MVYNNYNVYYYEYLPWYVIKFCHQHFSMFVVLNLSLSKLLVFYCTPKLIFFKNSLPRFAVILAPSGWTCSIINKLRAFKMTSILRSFMYINGDRKSAIIQVT